MTQASSSEWSISVMESRLAEVRREIDAACERSGRNPGEVTLVAVSKRHPVQAVRAALAAGHHDFGESYAQELRDKARELSGAPEDLRWHYIGPLQRNKVKYVVGVAVLVHAVDSDRLLQEIERRAEGRQITQDVLVQVNLAEEPQKYGISEPELIPLLHAFQETPHVRCRGLMLMPPWDPDPEAARPLFRRLRELRDRLLQGGSLPEAVSLDALSMGMSHDFHVAIQEGATLVRVGTALFGERP